MYVRIKPFRFVMDTCSKCGYQRVLALNKGESEQYKKKCPVCKSNKVVRMRYRCPEGSIAVSDD